MAARLPNFFFIGPDKAGSTWVYKALKLHPEIYMPNVKDICYWTESYERGWDWYERFFEGVRPEHRVVAEVCHDYLFSDAARTRIAKDLRGAKIMVCLREPVERAFSSYLYMVKQGRVKTDFETALRNIDELIEHGRYVKYLEAYLDIFGRENVYVGAFDELRLDSQLFFNKLCDFLGISHVALPPRMKQEVLPASRPRFSLLAALLKKAGVGMRQLGFVDVVQRAKDSIVVNKLLYVPYGKHERPAMAEATRKSLRIEFHPEIEQLDRMLGTNFLELWRYHDGGSDEAEKEVKVG